MWATYMVYVPARSGVRGCGVRRRCAQGAVYVDAGDDKRARM